MDGERLGLPLPKLKVDLGAMGSSVPVGFRPDADISEPKLKLLNFSEMSPALVSLPSLSADPLPFFFLRNSSYLCER